MRPAEPKGPLFAGAARRAAASRLPAAAGEAKPHAAAPAGLKAIGPAKGLEAERPSNDWGSPIKAGFGLIGLSVLMCAGWAGTAKLDAAVMAEGRVSVESERKAVQHFEGGIVGSILARDGDRVAEGQVVMRIDPTQAQASSDMVRLQIAGLLAEEARLLAEIERRAEIAFPPEIATSQDPSVIRMMQDQQRQFADRQRARAGEIGILERRVAQLEDQKRGAAAQRESAESQALSFQAEMERLKPLVARGAIAGNRFSALERESIAQTGRIGALVSDEARLAENIAEARLQISQLGYKFAEEAIARMSEARQKLSEAREREKVSGNILARAEIRAPRAGRIVGSRIHTLGAVVRQGETIMEIVPEDDVLVVTARVSPLDIIHVQPGMAAEVRLPAFKARTTPIALGEVVQVGADALRDEATRSSYYDMKVSVRVASFPERVREQLRPGMTAEVVVATGERTVLAYLVQPMADAMRKGMRER